MSGAAMPVAVHPVTVVGISKSSEAWVIKMFAVGAWVQAAIDNCRGKVARD